MWVAQLNFFILLAAAIGGFIIVFKGSYFKNKGWERILGFALIVGLVLYGVIPSFNEMIEIQNRDSERMATPKEPVSEVKEETEEEYNIRMYGFKPKNQTIEWDEARSYIDQTVTIEGTVVETTYHEFDGGIDNGGSAIFYLNLGNAFPDANRFTAIIWYEDILNGNVYEELTLPSAVEGNTIQITGTVIDYEGVPEIEILSNRQVKLASPALGDQLNVSK